jgi:hypothetical protein
MRYFDVGLIRRDVVLHRRQVCVNMDKKLSGKL